MIISATTKEKIAAVQAAEKSTRDLLDEYQELLVDNEAKESALYWGWRIYQQWKGLVGNPSRPEAFRVKQFEKYLRKIHPEWLLGLEDENAGSQRNT